MTKTTITKTLFAALFIFSGSIASANTLSFLSDISIKDSGMAGASAVYSTDSFSPFVNPAGLGLVERQEIGLVYYNLFEGASLSAAAYCLPLMEKGTFSISGVMVNSGSVEERDINNTLVSTFNDSYTAVFASYGISLLDFMSAGLTVKYIYHDFYSENSTGIGADMGLLFVLPYDFRAGLTAANIIKPEFRYTSGASDTLPLRCSFSAGWSGTFLSELNDLFKAAAVLTFEEHSGSAAYSAGVEYSIHGIFSLRGGINNEGFAAGASVEYQNAGLHYALVQKPADLVHRFSVAYSFGDRIRDLEKKFRDKEAKARYELVEKIKSETIDEFEKEVNSLINAGDYENAKKTIGKALVWAPENGWFLEKEIQINELMRSDKIKSSLYDADFLIQNALYIDALVALKNVLDLEPNNAVAAARMKRTQELIRTLGEDNYSVESGNKEIIQKHFEAGLDYYTTAKYDRAITEWDQVIKASPLQSQVYKYIKSAQDKLKHLEKTASIKKAGEEKKLSGLYNEAVVLYTKGEFEKSIGIWKEYLKLDPDNTEAREYIEKITKEYLELQKQKLEW